MVGIYQKAIVIIIIIAIISIITAFDPPPHFRKIILRILQQNCDKSAYAYYGRTVIT